MLPALFMTAYTCIFNWDSVLKNGFHSGAVELSTCFEVFKMSYICQLQTWRRLSPIFWDLHAEFVWCTVRRNLDKSGPRKTCHFRLGEDAFIKQCLYSNWRVSVPFLDCHLCPFHVDEKLLKKERRNHNHHSWLL